MSNLKIFLVTTLNVVLAALISSGVSYYFQKENLRDEQLITFRKEEIKKIYPLITEAKSIIEEIEKLEITIRKEDYIELPNGGLTMPQDVSVKTGRIIDLSNKLGEMTFKFPYQHRIVLIQAKNHFFNQSIKKSFPKMAQKNLKTENFTAASFAIALDIASENFILDGEPRHKELAVLFQ